jgi:hypothetical protein
LPAKTPRIAVEDLRRDLQRAVSCLSRVVLVASGARPPGPHALAFPGDGGPIRLGADPDLRLLVRLRFLIEQVEPPDRGWIARPTAYQFALIDGPGPELVAFHWHPGGRSPVEFPHVHAPIRTDNFDLRGRHVPTGLVPLAAVIRFAISELGLAPLRPDWAAVLEQLAGQANSGPSPAGARSAR